MPRSVRVLLLALPLVVTGGLVPAGPADASLSAVTGDSSWFRDPLTTAQRSALVPVPDHPKSVHGKLQRTAALWKSHDGTLAVPAVTARGHQLQHGQAVTLSRRNLFTAGTSKPTQATRERLATLATSLDQVTAITCEGYTDFSGDAAREQRLSQRRAARICALLSGRTDLKTTSYGFGRQVPVLVGGTPSQRAANRRIVVVATEDRPAATPSNPTPGAPTLSSVETSGHWAQLHFSPPGDPGSSAISGYEWSTDGDTWTALDPSGSPSLSAWISSLPTGTATYQVRAINTSGAGQPSNAVPGTISGATVPDAPSWVGPYAECNGSVMDYSQINSNPVDPSTTTGVQYSIDNGRTWVTPPQADLINGEQWRFSLPNSAPACATQLYMAIRYTSANGLGAASAFVPVDASSA